MRQLTIIMIVFTVVGIGSAAGQSTVMDLSGTWQVHLDRKDVGQTEKWFANSLPGNDYVQLPGSVQAQGLGDDPGMDTLWTGNIRHEEWNKPKYAPYRNDENFKMPFWLQPKKCYQGAAWFQQTVTIPENWQGKHITLTLERPHWETQVWVDGRAVGSKNYLSVAHVYDLSNDLTPGDHRLTIRVDNRMVINVGPNSHSVSDHTQSNWNGIVGALKLQAQAPVWIEDLQVYPNLKDNCVKVKTQIMNRTGKTQKSVLHLEVLSAGQVVGEQTLRLSKTTVQSLEKETTIELTKPVQTWDAFCPHQYTLRARLKYRDVQDIQSVRFGMREIRLDRNRLMLNGRPAFMRGTLECCIFPETGYPPADVEAWKRIIKVCKAHGLNHIRFHSWCPPKAAFIAADELGFYYQVECSSWANQGAKLGVGQPVDQWLYDEADAILKAYGNHPSFLLFAYGNEPGGPGRGGDYLKKWVPHYQAKDKRRLLTSGAGWPLIEESDFHVTHHGTRIQGWGEGLRSRINSKPPETVTDYRETIVQHPNQSVISHEIGQWCVYPNFEEMQKYTGVLQAKNFEVFYDFLKQKNLQDQAHDFLMASGKLQVLCYKEDIESALRTPNFGGFQLLDLHDFPGQGTALVGVIDPFWDSKPYVTPAEYARFCGPIVPLARLPKRTFVSSDTLSAQIDISQFGPADLEDVTVGWALCDSQGKKIKHGSLDTASLPAGGLYTVGDITLGLSDLPVPAKYTLILDVRDIDIENDWDIWVYPDVVTMDSQSIRIVEELNDETARFLYKGGKVLLTLDPTHVKTDVQLGFSSIFWNTAWTAGQAPHTLGVLCDPQHPALAEFPTEYHSNWQWSEPIQNAATLELDTLPEALKPIVQIVPDWFEPKKLALVFEAKVGKGSLVVSSVDLVRDIKHRPIECQLRHSLLAYMESRTFNPRVQISVEAIRSLYHRSSDKLQGMDVEIKASSMQPGYETVKAIDGKAHTFWHSRYQPSDPLPHSLILTLPQSTRLQGLTYLPRQDMANGRIIDYAVYVSQEAERWSSPVKRGKLSNDNNRQAIHFSQPVEGQYIKLEILSGVKDVAAVAELDVIVP